MGHFLPDYTAYEELLSVFQRPSSIPILLDRIIVIKFHLETLKKEEILGRGLRAMLINNHYLNRAVSGKGPAATLGAVSTPLPLFFYDG